MFFQTVRWWRRFPQDGGGIFRYLDQLGGNHCLEPEEILQHLLEIRWWSRVHGSISTDIGIWLVICRNIFWSGNRTYADLHMVTNTTPKETYLERIRSQGRDANPFFCMMGINVGTVGDGEASLSMEVRPDMYNGVGWLQGGIFTALADEAMALALYTQTSRDQQIATVTETTTFLRGVRKGVITATGRVVKRGRRVAFTEGEVREGGTEGNLLARTTAAFVILK